MEEGKDSTTSPDWISAGRRWITSRFKSRIWPRAWHAAKMEEGKGFDHQSRVDLMTAGAIGRLLPKLGEFLKQEHNLQTSMKGHIEPLEIHLWRMENALPRAQQDQFDPQEHNHCVNELRELAYDTEDIVDNLMLCMDEGKQEVTQPTINQDSFKNIKVRVDNLAAWRTANLVPTAIRTVEPCLEDGFKQVRQLVGIHKLKAELISTISSSSSKLKIVSIWGPGGMGKTALANSVYENIRENFQCTAFVCLGRQRDMKKALTDILIPLGQQKYHALDKDELQLINELRYYLADKKFLIVIDDIWNIEWEVLKIALVDNGLGSRIITTSRIFDVVRSSDGEVFELMPLTIDCSKELFYATLFCGHKSTITFDRLVEQSIEYVLQKCGGVPLAIIIIASLLAGKPQEEWTEVCNSIGFGHESNIGAAENTGKIIQFSYLDLPSHLKTCLLYLSIFPEDHVIEKDTLVWRWVAEGFVHDDKKQGESLFKAGERYFYELVCRSMIQPVENEDTDIRGYCVHNVVLDFINFVAHKQNFVQTASSRNRRSNNARMMVVYNELLNQIMWKQNVRSFNVTSCSIISRAVLHPRSFQVLRVLSLEDCKLTGSTDEILENLIERSLHLRYLGLREINIHNLPSGVGGLRYLQTLDLTKTYIRELPISVTQLRQLKFLRCFSPMLELPKGMGHLTSLEELRLGIVDKFPNVADELSQLTELRVLVLHIGNRESFDGNWMEASVESLSKLQKIEELELFRNGSSGDDTCCHVIAPGGFPKMRYLSTNIWLMYQPGAMPCLKSVELEIGVRAFKDANFDFHDFYKLSYLRSLEKAHVGIDCWGAKIEEAEEVEVALRRVLKSHPNHPKLILSRFGQCEDHEQVQCEDDEQVQCEDDKQICFLTGLHDSGMAPQFMPMSLLRKITNNFSKERRLGSGTFGTVYKGVLINDKEVAVKLLHSMRTSLNYEKDFMKEFGNLTRLNHPNIVQLLGYCYEIKRVCVSHEGKYVLADDMDRALCFDYMHNGSLQQHLDNESRGLDWQTRYKCIKGICEGLKYLHKGLENPMFHLDLKPGNILLDKDMVPKLADFGLSKLVSDNQTQVASSCLGTIGYCPPEHIDHKFVSDKFDIFSLGVVMLEIIAGPKGYSKTVEKSSQGFIDGVQENWRKRIHQQVTPRSTSPNYECCQVKRCIEIALECVHHERMQRPDIEDIIRRLNKTENNTEESAMTSSSQNET